MSARCTVRGARATVSADVTARAALTGTAGVRHGRHSSLRSDRLDRAAIVHIRLTPSPRRGRPRPSPVVAGCGATLRRRNYLAVRPWERE